MLGKPNKVFQFENEAIKYFDGVWKDLVEPVLPKEVPKDNFKATTKGALVKEVWDATVEECRKTAKETIIKNLFMSSCGST